MQTRQTTKTKTSLTDYAARHEIPTLDAIEHAIAAGFVLHKYADPTEPARSNLTADEAKDVAREDPSLIWVERDH